MQDSVIRQSFLHRKIQNSIMIGKKLCWWRDLNTRPPALQSNLKTTRPQWHPSIYNSLSNLIFYLLTCPPCKIMGPKIMVTLNLVYFCQYAMKAQVMMNVKNFVLLLCFKYSCLNILHSVLVSVKLLNQY